MERFYICQAAFYRDNSHAQSEEADDGIFNDFGFGDKVNLSFCADGNKADVVRANMVCANDIGLIFIGPFFFVVVFFGKADEIKDFYEK